MVFNIDFTLLLLHFHKFDGDIFIFFQAADFLLKNFWGYKSFLWDHWHYYFGLLLTSALSF